ncbi:MAG: 2-hydroxychromene-2-carboxylate isomerase [Alphaproteobacteria bacterium]|jgi:2-hydroxychromene-2-carboxylate isomerase|nr:2-hydroxychromene-2-carboxylate isomerase [Alphaproteobacteria bacterium]MBT4018190.1 2-hydroxychromene-2-carboxylate isomerase [Alphaproteobacteria bacterium]MBT4965083.1 2-hydroxychromene-2-carboxylate isomerase [Alphaproteobacteria bacterium]MBT5160763.1 2-hydroxychromene-2-carboxylate isomerase [Alphaproteobacteria bacterium]MBT5918656.1 2-hydroxychromene-2-carboxylate isomerase [Alphaproteobacteria bacterium]
MLFIPNHEQETDLARLEFFFDISSPWTYLAFENIQPLAAETGTEISWRPFMVGGLFNTINPSVYEMRANPVPAKWDYMTKDLADWATWSGLKIKWQPTVFPVNSVKVMRACLVAIDNDKLVPFARACFELYWGEDKDISQNDVVAEACQRAGLDPTGVGEAIQQPALKQRLIANSEELIERGGFGTPTIYLNKTDMYFGNDRLPLIKAAIEKG